MLLSALILVLVAPLMIAIAAAVKLSSPGPIIFRQRRYGLDGKEIVVYKFRTMRVMEDGPDVPQATRDDPRVTKLGAVLRATSLDELPQLQNLQHRVVFAVARAGHLQPLELCEIVALLEQLAVAVHHELRVLPYRFDPGAAHPRFGGRHCRHVGALDLLENLRIPLGKTGGVRALRLLSGGGRGEDEQGSGTAQDERGAGDPKDVIGAHEIHPSDDCSLPEQYSGPARGLRTRPSGYVVCSPSMMRRRKRA